VTIDDLEVPTCITSNSQSRPICRFLFFVVSLGLFTSGCGGPTETTRDNRRLLDAVLTAVTIRNLDEVKKDKELLDARLARKQISEDAHTAIQTAIDMALAKDWAAAERELYEFREQSPFPK
jgi:hypothetical protein